MTLLDTHVFVWLASDQNALSPAALGAIEKDRESLFISVVTSWEIALLHKKGRLLLPLPPNEFVEKAVLHHQCRLVTKDETIPLYPGVKAVW